MKQWKAVQIGFILGALCLGMAACTESEQPVIVGLLNSSVFTEDSIDGFKVGMAELGYVEGETIQYRYAGILEDPNALTQEAQQLAAADVDIIFTATTIAAQAAQTATENTQIPVVFDAVVDAEAAGLVQSRQQPGGHMTGISVGNLGAQILQKNIEWLIKIAPDTERIYAVYDADLPEIFVKPALDSLLLAEERVGVDIILSPMTTVADAETLLEDLGEGDAVFMFNSPLTFDYLVVESKEKKIPLGVQSQNGVEQGALFAYVTDLKESGKQGARLVDQILQGQDPAELPVEFPELYLSINLQTAVEIGLEIPNNVLDSAHQLIR